MSVVPGSHLASWSLTILHIEMKEVAACGIFILLFDAVLCSAHWAILLLLQISDCGGLAGVWAFGAVKWVFLHVFTSTLTEGKPHSVLRQLVALLCLLSPVLETGRIIADPPSGPYTGPSPDLSMVLVAQVSSLLACAVWEKGLFGNGNKKKSSSKLDTRRLLIRVLKYFKPDTLYLISAFGFLILGVICKCEIISLHILAH